MNINRKITIPLSILALSVVAGSWIYKSGKMDHGAGLFKKDHVSKQEQGGTPLYTCPMHPFIIKDKPGSCPICGMDLVKKLNDAKAAEGIEMSKENMSAANVSMSPVQRTMANVATVVAKRQVLNKEINAVGIVQFDQSRQAKVTAWIGGRIDQLHVNTVGSFVSKDKPVAEVYSPDLLASQQEYLLAVKSRDQLKKSPIPSIAQNGDGLVASARQRLMLFGVKESQLAALEKAGKPNIRLPIYTPLSGVVIEKLVQQGQYVNTGDVLFNIADLSTVWVEVEVYENEFPNIHIGQQVEIRSQSFPDRPFTGKIAFIYPFLDPKTRTVKARVAMPNPGMKLKPDMFVNAVIKVPLGAALVVPVTAVMDTGKRQVVWVEVSPNMFEPREIQPGQRTDDKVQVLSGLKPGEKVAVSGAYLIDSESQLKGGGGQDHSQHGGGAKSGSRDSGPDTSKGEGHEGHTTAPQPAKPAPAKKSLNIDDMKM